MAEYISREAVRDLMYHKQGALAEYDLDSVPAADVAPVRHSYWIDNIAVEVDGSVLHDYECAECTIHSGVDTAFCPKCGAKMDKEK